jgi:threonine dehydratase
MRTRVQTRKIDDIDVEAARARLEGVAHRTPVFEARSLEERLGARVFLKAENMQRVGAFKFRGAYNHVSALSR